MATSPDEECVICISAKATMQTFPCGHRVVCRKCFVKTIQMVVSQRMLPLRCVICRAKVLRLTTGSGFPSNGNSSGGYMRTNSKNEFREKMCSAHVLRPNSFLAPFPCSTVPFGSRNLESESDSLNEVLQKHDGLCELRLENIDYWLGLSSPENEPPSPYSQTDPDEMIPNVSVRDNLYEQFNRLTCSNEAYFGNLSVFWSHDAPKKAKKHRLIAHRVSVQWPHYRKQQFRSDRASRNQKILDNNHKIVRSSLSLLPRMEWQDQKTESKSSHIRNNSLESCKSGEFDASLRAIKSNDYPIPLYNPLLSAYLPLWYPSRTKKYSRHLQYRHLFGGKQTFQLHSAQQPQFMNIFGGHQNQFSPRDSFATNRIKNVRYWQRWPHSLLLPIREEDEDQFNASACEAEQQELIKNFISLSESSESIAISQIFERNSIRINQQALQKAQKPNVMPALICNFDDSKTVNCKKSKQETQHIQTKDKQHKQLYQRQIKMYTNVRMRKSRSESFLASNKRYRRLRENKSNTESESESPTDDCINSEFRYLLASKQKNASNQTSTALYDQNIRDDDDNFSERASFKPVKSSSLTSLISNKIQESFKMFRSFKLR